MAIAKGILMGWFLTLVIFQCTNRAESDGHGENADLIGDLPKCFDEELRFLIACHRTDIENPDETLDTIWIDTLGMDCSSLRYLLQACRIVDKDDFYLPVMIEHVGQSPTLEARTNGVLSKVSLGEVVYDSSGYVIFSPAQLRLFTDFGNFSCDSIVRISPRCMDVPTIHDLPKTNPEKLKVW